MTRGHEAAHDPYWAVRCVTCGHLSPTHDGDWCLAGQHTVPCRCEGYLSPLVAS